MREEILSLGKDVSEFATERADEVFRTTLSTSKVASDADVCSLFSSAILNLSRIDWNSPVSVVEKVCVWKGICEKVQVLQGERVHPSASLEDLHRRLEGGRECWALFHPRMDDVDSKACANNCCRHPLLSFLPTFEMTSHPASKYSEHARADNSRGSSARRWSIGRLLLRSIRFRQLTKVLSVWGVLIAEALEGVDLGQILIKRVVSRIQVDRPCRQMGPDF